MVGNWKPEEGFSIRRVGPEPFRAISSETVSCNENTHSKTPRESCSGRGAKGGLTNATERNRCRGESCSQLVDEQFLQPCDV